MNFKNSKKYNIRSREIRELREKGKTENLSIAGEEISVTVVTIDSSTCESAILVNDFMGKHCILRKDAETAFESQKDSIERKINDLIIEWDIDVIIGLIEKMLYPVFPKCNW